MKKSSYLVALLALLLCSGVIFALNEPGEFILVDNNTGIQRVGAPQPFMRCSDLPDTIPPYFPHPKEMRLKNERFHFLTQSPDKAFLGFASGVGDQWIGVMNLKERYMKFLSWGMQTRFLDMTFSPTGKYIAYTYHGPDHRTKVMIVETPDITTAKPKAK